ncbi:MFS transporter [Brevibacillus porteri]|uniref:MFS transporter n=1 Tax=Brevibacillus porteri TaxID=2126350 RepID=UPI00364092DB
MSVLQHDLEKRTVSKITKRIIPFLFLLYIVAYLDRANIGYAALEMNKSLGLTSEAFGLVSGIFFIGYFLFEVPSNVLLQRFGARKWIARILVTWGLIGSLTGFVQNEYQLYILRFLLGVAEAGFFPGIILYLTYWYRGKDLAKTISLFMTAIAASFIIGAPLSGWIMDNVQLFKLEGWRWMFILEGLPAVFLGFVTLAYLPDRPRDAKWLAAEEKKWIQDELDKEATNKITSKHHSMKEAFRNPKIWLLSLVYFLYITGGLGIGFWMPQIIKGLSNVLTNTQVGLITMVPYIVAAVVMNIWGRRSDRKGERFFHAALPLVVAAVALFGIGLGSNPFTSIGLIIIALSALNSFNGPYWALPPHFLKGSTAAVGIAFINSMGNLGGFLGPYLMGALKSATGGVSVGLYVLSGCMLVACLLLLWMRKKYVGKEGNMYENPLSPK